MDLNDLSPELREKARNCKTSEEILDLARREGYELSDDELDAVSGGIEWYCSDDACSGLTPPCDTDVCMR